MRDHSNRDITFYDVLVTSEPKIAPVKSMEYFTAQITTLFENEKTAKWSRDKSKKTHLKELEINEEQGYALLLIYFADANTTGASYAHLDDDTQRNEELDDREGRPESVHLLISLQSAQEGQFRYLAILEDSSKLNRQHVQSYLNFLIRAIKRATSNKDFKAETPDGAKEAGKPKKYTYTNKLEFQGHPSPDFQKMLEEGRLSGISLETENWDKFGFGESTYVKPKRKEVLLTPAEGKWSEHPVKRFTEAVSLGKNNDYEMARIVFQAPDGRSHTARIDTETGLVVGEKFIKRKRLSGFSTLLRDADEVINPEIRTKLLAYFNEGDDGE